MTTNNIVSTPNITGNVGSCETKTVETQTSAGYFSASYHAVLTNSCTGQIVNTYDYVSPWTPLTIFGFPFFLFIVLIAWGMSN